MPVPPRQRLYRPSECGGKGGGGGTAPRQRARDALFGIGWGGAQPPVCQHADQLRPAVEPDADRTTRRADSPHWPDTAGVHLQLVHGRVFGRTDSPAAAREDSHVRAGRWGGGIDPGQFGRRGGIRIAGAQFVAGLSRCRGPGPRLRPAGRFAGGGPGGVSGGQTA